MTAQEIISRLDKVRQTGNDRWIARCPAHDDKTPSLSIRETDDGVILLHCFSCQDTPAILSALNMNASDLFPRKLNHDETHKIKPNHWHAAREALQALSQEVLIVAIAADDAARGFAISKEDAQRIILAAQRIRNAAAVCQ